METESRDGICSLFDVACASAWFSIQICSKFVVKEVDEEDGANSGKRGTWFVSPQWPRT